MASKNKPLKSLQDLKTILSTEQQQELSKADYQKKWEKKTNIYRRVVSEKNRKWLKDGRKVAVENNHLDYFKQNQEYYDIIENDFNTENKVNFYIHLISHFLPIDRTFKAPQIPSSKHICPITKLELTSLKGIRTGDRDKHLAFGSETSTVLLSGMGLQELERFVLDMTKCFNTKNGQIVNFAVDKERLSIINKGNKEE